MLCENCNRKRLQIHAKHAGSCSHTAQLNVMMHKVYYAICIKEGLKLPQIRFQKEAIFICKGIGVVRDFLQNTFASVMSVQKISYTNIIFFSLI
jgi:hypothetical protein